MMPIAALLLAAIIFHFAKDYSDIGVTRHNLMAVKTLHVIGLFRCPHRQPAVITP
jgi:hypothetical protein